jgi:hypothetical protein
MSRLASSKTAQIWAERFAQGERSNAPVAQAYPGRRFALPWAISFCPFGADGSGAGQRPEAGGERREGTAKQPENFGAILSRYPRITQNAGTVPGYFLRCALVSIPSSQGDPAEVSLRVLQNRPKFGPNGSPRANDPMLPSRKRTQGGASLCPGLSPFAPLGRTDRWIWLATWQRLAKS